MPTLGASQLLLTQVASQLGFPLKIEGVLVLDFAKIRDLLLSEQLLLLVDPPRLETQANS